MCLIPKKFVESEKGAKLRYDGNHGHGLFKLYTFLLNEETVVFAIVSAFRRHV